MNWYMVIDDTGTNIETDIMMMMLLSQIKTLTLFLIATGMLSLLWNLIKIIQKCIQNSSINVNQLGNKIPIEESSHHLVSCMKYECRKYEFMYIVDQEAHGRFLTSNVFCLRSS